MGKQGLTACQAPAEASSSLPNPTAAPDAKEGIADEGEEEKKAPIPLQMSFGCLPEDTIQLVRASMGGKDASMGVEGGVSNTAADVEVDEADETNVGAGQGGTDLATTTGVEPAVPPETTAAEDRAGTATTTGRREDKLADEHAHDSHGQQCRMVDAAIGFATLWRP